MNSSMSLGTVLVVGGCGNLGRRLVDDILERQLAVELSVLDLTVEPKRNPRTSYHVCDITNKGQVLAFLKRIQPQVIFHTASPPPTINDMELHLRVNVTGTQNLVECARAIGCVKAFVYTSTASVIHDANGDLIDGDETCPLVFLPKQKEVYSHTKALAEQIVLASNERGKMLTVCIRPSSIFGENDTTQVRNLIESAAAGKLRVQIGDGKNLFDFTYVGNVVDAEILAAQRLVKQTSSNREEIPIAEKIDGEAFTVTNDEHVLFWEYLRSLAAAAGYPVDTSKVWILPTNFAIAIAIIVEWFVWMISFGHRRPGITRVAIKYSSMTRTYNIDKIKERLGYRPRVGMEEGIYRTGQSFHIDREQLKKQL